MTVNPEVFSKHAQIKHLQRRRKGAQGGLGEPCCRSPPHTGAGIAIKGDAWVSEWYPAATESNILKMPNHRKKNEFGFGHFWEVFEKTKCLSRLPHSYFLYVGVAR